MRASCVRDLFPRLKSQKSSLPLSSESSREMEYLASRVTNRLTERPSTVAETAVLPSCISEVPVSNSCLGTGFHECGSSFSSISLCKFGIVHQTRSLLLPSTSRPIKYSPVTRCCIAEPPHTPYLSIQRNDTLAVVNPVVASIAVIPCLTKAPSVSKFLRTSISLIPFILAQSVWRPATDCTTEEY
jgi:hypothetical protein